MCYYLVLLCFTVLLTYAFMLRAPVIRRVCAACVFVKHTQTSDDAGNHKETLTHPSLQVT